MANITILKELLSIARDTNCSANGVDTPTQMTSEQIKTLSNNGIYLTGSVGSGSNKLDRSLSLYVEEIDNILRFINPFFQFIKMANKK